MRNQKETLRMDAPRFSRSHVPVIGFLIALVIGFVFYTTLAFVNYRVGGPLLHGHLRSFVYALGAPFWVAFAMVMLAVGLRKMRKEGSAWYTQPTIFNGLGLVGVALSTLVISEGLSNDLLSLPVTFILVGLFFACTIICYLCAVIIPRQAKTRLLKEAREE
jgi:hypothetical protein